MSSPPGSSPAATASAADLERLAVDTIRTLAMDAVQAANSGHPGLPMGMAPAAYVLFREVMRHNPKDPSWPDRDRFILSAGHGSMLLYASLHLSGYDLSLEEIKRFRQWGSLTPGHPERDRVHVTPGVEITTGPLGQGFGNGVGMAIAERFLRERFGPEVMDHRVFAICSDGDLMEGVASEAASLAGHLGLDRIVYLYDDNSVSLDGPAALSFSEDVPARFRAYGWHTLTVDDANDLDALRSAIAEGIAEGERPTLISVKSIIGWPAPHVQGTSEAHGKALGEDEVRATKEIMGWDPDAHFLVPDGVYEHFSAVERGEALEREWGERLEAWRARHAELARVWDAAWASPARPLPGLAEALPDFSDTEKIATRNAGGKVMAAMEPFTPTMVGGAADLSESTKTLFGGEPDSTRARLTRNIRFGVREHGMGAAVNGMAGHGGILRPYGSTFLQFADYMRGAIRLSALMGLEVAWVFTHDSVALGEDGPTHQPVEHLAAVDDGGWMHTGDLAVMDADGYVNIVGRLKDMVIRGGENIYPREIEEVLFQHPAVAATQVIGVPDPPHGRRAHGLGHVPRRRRRDRGRPPRLLSRTARPLQGAALLEDHLRVPDDRHRQGPEVQDARDRDRRARTRAGRRDPNRLRGASFGLVTADPIPPRRRADADHRTRGLRRRRHRRLPALAERRAAADPLRPRDHRAARAHAVGRGHGPRVRERRRRAVRRPEPVGRTRAQPDALDRGRHPGVRRCTFRRCS